MIMNHWVVTFSEHLKKERKKKVDNINQDKMMETERVYI